jgi:hypothetical protein
MHSAPQRRVLLVLWFSFIFLASAGMGLYTTRACDGGEHNIGTFINHSCDGSCGSAPEDICELDVCLCGGGGYQYYCISILYCGRYPGCAPCYE